MNTQSYNLLLALKNYNPRVLKNNQDIICLDVSVPNSCSASSSRSILAPRNGLSKLFSTVFTTSAALETQMASLGEGKEGQRRAYHLLFFFILVTSSLLFNASKYFLLIS